MTRRLRFASAGVVWLLLATTALAAADPLAVIPDTALGLAVVNNLADASTRVQKLTEKMQLPVPELLPMVQLYTGAQQGVDTQGSLAAAVFSDDHEDATWGISLAVFVPVTDYKAFIAQLQPDDADAAISTVSILGEQFLATHKGEFAVLAASGQKYLLEQIQAATTSLVATLDPLRPWLEKQQAAVVVTPAGKTLLVAQVGAFLETALKAADEAQESETKEEGEADDAKAGADDAKAAADAANSLREMMSSFKDLLAAADRQLTQLGVGVRIDDSTALHVSTRMLFAPRGELSQWAEKATPPKAGLLAGLPPGRFALVYGGIAANFHPALAKLIDRLTENGLVQMGLSDEDRKKFSELTVQQRANQESSGTLLGQLRPGDSIIGTSMSVEHVKDAARHLQLTRELFGVLAKVKPPGDDPKPLYSISEVTVGDVKALEVVTDMSAALGAAGAQGAGVEQFRGLFSKLFGGEGEMHAYMAAANDHTVVTAYSKELLTRSIEHIRGKAPGLETDPAIKQTAALLPEGSQWMVYLSPQGIVQWVGEFVRQLPGMVDIQIPPFPPSDPIGLAARVSASGLDAEIVLPESVVAGIGQYVGTIQQMLQGGAPLP